MAKTRSQVLHSPTKKEECKDKHILHSTNTTFDNKNKITKNKESKTSSIQVQVEKINSENATDYTADNMEDDTDDEEPDPLTLVTTLRPRITNEQLTNLIGFIVNDNMTVSAAAREVEMDSRTAAKYYKEYQNDPEHKIPLPKAIVKRVPVKTTQKKINDVIHYIVHEKMCPTQAAKKVNMNRGTAVRYYEEYLNDTERKIPTLKNPIGQAPKRYTEEQVKRLVDFVVQDKMNITEASEKVGMSYGTARMYYNKYISDPERKIPSPLQNSGKQAGNYTIDTIKSLIGYIVDDKISITAASKKLNMPYNTAKRYYMLYLDDPEHNIPLPRVFVNSRGRCCPNNKVKEFIGYIVNDKMTLLEAAIKANVGTNTAARYYREYLDDPNRKIPTPENNSKITMKRSLTLEQVNNFFNYIIVEDMNITMASRKADISFITGGRLYKKYIQNPTEEYQHSDNSYSVEKMKKMIGYIQNDKMTVTTAAKKAKLCSKSAKKFYNQYLKDPQHRIPTMKSRYYPPEALKRLFDYIEKDKMGIKPAARKMKMGASAASKYYKAYKTDPEHKIPVPTISEHTLQKRIFEKYSNIVADIYKNNPTIVPIHLRQDESMEQKA